MTKNRSFKKVVRRHAEETNQRYTESLSDLTNLESRLVHDPDADRLLAHLRDSYAIDPIAVTKISAHNDHVFRVDHHDGNAWVARVFPPARSRSSVEGDAAILRFLERNDYPAERLALDDAVSAFNGSSVLLTQFIDGAVLPDNSEKFSFMGDLLGRLHALTPDDSIRVGGAGGDDSWRAGHPRQDLLAGLSFLDSVSTKITIEHRERFEQLREMVRSADDATGLPESLLHGNLLHTPDHALLTADGPVAFNWKSAGIGPRLADFAYLMWGALWCKGDAISAATSAYRRHVALTDEELDRLDAVMFIRPLYLTCFDYRRAVQGGDQPDGTEWWWGFIDPQHIQKTAELTRSALRR